MSEQENTETTEAPVDANKVIAQDIFDQGQEDGSSRDSIIVAMVQGGLSLNYSQNIYKELAKEAGLEVTRGGHKTEALALLEGAGIDPDDFITVEVRSSLREQLREKFGVAESTANDYLKAYAVKHDIELPGGGGPTSEMAGKIYDFVMANPDCDKAAFKDFMEGFGRSKGNIDENWRGVLLARRLLASGYEYNEPEEVEEEAA
jgi:hypothetical protein